MNAAVSVVLLGAAANIHNVSGYGAACLVTAALLVLVWPLVEYLCKPAPAPFGGSSSPQSTLAGGPAQRPFPSVASAVSTPKSQSPVGSFTRGKGGKGFHEGAAPGDVAFSADVMRQLTGRGVASGTALDDLATDRYLGKGTFGVVNLCTHKPSGEKVVVKEVPVYADKDAADINQLITEVALGVELRHPCIVRCRGMPKRPGLAPICRLRLRPSGRRRRILARQAERRVHVHAIRLRARRHARGGAAQAAGVRRELRDRVGRARLLSDRRRGALHA